MFSVRSALPNNTTGFSVRGLYGGYYNATLLRVQFSHPCGGGIEYLHRDPASRRRRRKGKSQI
jgi:hypothetical protein